MSQKGHRWAPGAAIVAIAAVGAGQFLGPTTRLEGRHDWESFSSGLRRAGQDNFIAGQAQVKLQFPGLRPADSVRLVLASRPGLEPLSVEVSRGQAALAVATVGQEPVTLRVGPGPGAEIVVAVLGVDRPSRFLYHLREIRVERGGLRGLGLPALPFITGILVYAVAWRRRGWVLALIYAFLAVAVTIALAADPLTVAASPGLPIGSRVIAAMLSAAAMIVELGLGRLPRAAILGGFVLAVAVWLHVPGLNGPSYWRWEWQRLDGGRVGLAILGASVPLLAARLLYFAGKVRAGFALALVAVGVAVTATAVMAVQPSGLDRMHAIIEDPITTSYYTDAIDLAAKDAWLARYPEHLGALQGHSINKPPGPLLFYGALIKVFGANCVSAVIGALLIALAAAMAPPAVFLLARQLDESPEAAFESACVMAVAPSLILFFPEFDQAFPAMTCTLLWLWRSAVRGRLAAALGCGVCVFVASFFSFSFLVLGVAGIAIAALDPRRAARATVVTLSVALAAYALLFATTGFDPIATFRAASTNQADAFPELARGYLPAVTQDPIDFVMGAGWLGAFLAAVTLVRGWRSSQPASCATIGAAQIASVDLSGLLRGEAARVWLLLVPFVAIPAGRELSRWTHRERTAAYLTMLLVLGALAQNMRFLDPP